MGVTLNSVCSGRSTWQGSSSALLLYPDTELCYPVLNINCVIIRGRYLNLTQQHEIRTATAQKISNTALKPWSPSEIASNFNVLANQNKMNTGGMCEEMQRSCFHSRIQWKKDSGLVVKLLHMHLSLLAVWGGYLVGFDFRRGAGLALCVQCRLLWRTGTLMTCTVWSTGLKYQSNPHHLSSLQEHGLQFLASSSCIFRELISIAVLSEGKGIVFWKGSKCSGLYLFLKPPFETSLWIFSLIRSKT